MPTPIEFGLFIAPHHCHIGEDLTSALSRDLDVLQLADKLGFREAWIGEHHSGGAEPIPDPALFIAHAITQTRHIKLGTGVTSLPYHNPLWVADRMLLLDHLARGRAMLGVGSGAFATDAGMIGLGPEDLRGALEEDVGALMHILHSDEPLSLKTARYELVGARTQLRPYSTPMFETAVTAVNSPTGPTLAGRHGMGMISVAASSSAGFDALARHWSVVGQAAAEVGQPVPERAGWRLVAPMHIAPTRDEAINDVRFGLERFQAYFLDVLAGSIIQAEGRTADELIEWINSSGFGVVGTPDDAIEMIERLEDQSGGFGTFLLFHHEWALPSATQRHYELFARFVKPRFQRVTDRLQANADWCASVAGELRPKIVAATQQAIARYESRSAPDGT